MTMGRREPGLGSSLPPAGVMSYTLDIPSEEEEAEAATLRLESCFVPRVNTITVGFNIRL